MAFEKPNEAKLLELINRTGYKMLQENGQRRFGPNRNRDGSSPPKGCEVFVGRIPRDCFEDELFPIFEKAGSVYEMRLMMDFSGSNRGYAFVMYNSRDSARRAVMELDNFEIRRGKHIGVCMSVDNCRLFVGGIPKTRTREEIMAEMRRLTDGVVDVIVYPSAHDRQRNRGFAFVEYATHRDAAMARRKLIPGRIQFFGQSIAVDWAEPERNVDDDVMRTVRVLYVRNLPSDYDETRIRQLFVEAVGSEIEHSVERVRRIGNYAFVHFSTREHAELARAALHGRQLITVPDNNTAPSQIPGETLQMPLEVVFAKPPTRSCGRRGPGSDSIGNPNPVRRNANSERDNDMKGAEGGCKVSLARKSTRRAGDHANTHAQSSRSAAGVRSAVRRVGAVVHCENNVPYVSTVDQTDSSGAPVACSAVAPASYYSYAPPSMHAASYFLPNAATDYRVFRDASAPLRASVPLPDTANGYASLTNANAYGAAANTYSTAHNGYLSGAANYVSLSVNQPTGFVNAATGYVNNAGYATAMANGNGYGGPSQATLNFAAAFNTNSNAAPSGTALFSNASLPLGTDPTLVHQRSVAGGVSAQPAGLYSPFAAASTTALHGVQLTMPHYAIAAKPKQAIMNTGEQDGNNNGTVLLSNASQVNKNGTNGTQLIKAPNQEQVRVNASIQQRPNAHFSNMVNVVQPAVAQAQSTVAVESHNTAALVSTAPRC